MALPVPIPDNPLRWEGWRSYNSANLYARLCLDPNSNATGEVIEEHCRLLLVWWQKKLPLKNQPSNPMAQLLRQGLDEAPQFLAEARTKLLDSTFRTKLDTQLADAALDEARQDFGKILGFALADPYLRPEAEARLREAGSRLGLPDDELTRLIDAELERVGGERIASTPRMVPAQTQVPAVTQPAAHSPEPNEIASGAPAAMPGSGDPFADFRRILAMSKLCLDGEEMTDDQRDAMCNLGESLGLTGGQAEDLIDEYLEQAAMSPGTTAPTVTKNGAHPAQSVHPTPPKPRTVAAAPVPPAPSTPVPPTPAVVVAERPKAPPVSMAAARGINLSPAALAMERQKYPNFVNSIGMEFYLIPSGQFQMGSEGPDAHQSERPITPVTLQRFYCAKLLVTNVTYEKYDPTHRNRRSPWADDRHPVVHVNATEAENFCRWLSQKENRKYRLPTEAEWEYAARGSDHRKYPWGEELSAGNLTNFADARTRFAWRDPVIDDGFAESSPAGSYPKGASPFGLLDMAGNVWEWCLDNYLPYKGKEVINPKNLGSGGNRVMRGGSWRSRSNNVRTTARGFNLPIYNANDVGFRVVCECE